MEKLTIVIPSYNEYLKTAKTIYNIFETCSNKGNIEVIVVDDASKENYKDLSYNSKIKYIKNDNNLGVSQSRDIGIKKSSNNRILTIDAHVKFYKKGWDKDIVEQIDNNKKSLLCFACQNIKDNKTYYAGGFHFIHPSNMDLILSPYLSNTCKFGDIEDVPCVIGGAYAFDANWHKYLNGMTGMIGNGVGETFLSIKSYLAGGDCKLIKNIKIGHDFEKIGYDFEKIGCDFEKQDMYYNKIFMSQTILPMEMTSALLTLLPKNKEKENAVNLFQQNLSLMLKYKMQYEDILKVPFEEYVKKFAK